MTQLPDNQRGSRARSTALNTQKAKPGASDHGNRSLRVSHVVGVGASAGGLEALQDLLAHVPLDHFAFVVIQHQQPDRTSMLPHLLGRASAIHVLEADDGVHLTSNTAFVAPPNTHLQLRDGRIQFLASGVRCKGNHPIDTFFRSLAENQKEHAVGVVLSGNGADGTLGLCAIKAAGGVTFAQDPGTAKFCGMPKSAISRGCVDFSLPPKAIGGELTSISQKIRRLAPSLQNDSDNAKAPTGEQDEDHAGELLKETYVAIRHQFGLDFEHYKPGTLKRRLYRRMIFKKTNSVADYLSNLHSDPDELQKFYADLLITVTHFFRDQEAFKALEDKVLPELIQAAPAHEPLRLWVPACATGEEAYSVAICVAEALDRHQSTRRVQIFATDINRQAVAIARQGVYQEEIEGDITAERLSQFFSHANQRYQVVQRLRDMVVFSRHNLLEDAPFSRLHLVSCRNLLIYLQPKAQQNLLNIFHYALNSRGILVLGRSETTSETPQLYAAIESKWKFFRKKFLSSVSAPPLPIGVSHPPATHPPSSASPTSSLQALVDHKVIEAYSPPGVVVNQTFEVVSFRGDMGRYMAPSPGAVSLSILCLARVELRAELKRVLELAHDRQRRVVAEATFHDGQAPERVQLVVHVIVEPQTLERCLLVMFCPPALAEKTAQAAQPRLNEAVNTLDDKVFSDCRGQLEELRQELATTQGYLRATLQENRETQETTKKDREEMQCASEELQSANEELETSQEELQSANEELVTLNEELQERMNEYDHIQDDLHNLLLASDSVVLLVSLDLTLRRFTRAAEHMLSLTSTDIGRPIDILDRLGGHSEIAAKTATVIETLSVYEGTIVRGNHEPYRLRISPYKTLDHAIYGAIIQLSPATASAPITPQGPAEGPAALSQLLASVSQPLCMMDRRCRVVWANPAFYEQQVGLASHAVASRPVEALPILNVAGFREAGQEADLSGKISGFGRSLTAGSNPASVTLRGNRVTYLQLGSLVLVSIAGGQL